MPKIETLKVSQLTLDLKNFRTIPQNSEDDAIIAMVSTSPDRFWALLDSIVLDDYLPTESILVLQEGSRNQKFIVKEGNRRIAALKLLHGILKPQEIIIPEDYATKIKEVSNEWRQRNESVPCVIYEPKEKAIVDRIVTLTHGKGEKASREQWTAVARARHNRDEKNGSEPALDLLEFYLAEGRNHTKMQAARWAGDYPLTVLEEAMKRLAPRLGKKNSRELADAYPAIDFRDALESILHKIGLKSIGFEKIRQEKGSFGAKDGIPPANEADTSSKEQPDSTDGEDTGGDTKPKKGKKRSSGSKPKATRVDDPRNVKRLLRQLEPRGSGREKVVQLRDEIRQLNLNNTPLAFCFVLRSMFEISAKAYCTDHKGSGGPSFYKKGKEKKLAQALEDVCSHLTDKKRDKAKLKQLHGAMAELNKPEGLLSVTSMNQLVHNPSFLVTGTEVCILFGRIFPLLEEMNS